jgi:hypothetical protein
MRRIITLLLAAMTGGGVVYTAFQYHVVRSDQRLLLVPKQRADWHEAYVDIRGWTFREWGDHPDLTKNLTAAGHGELVGRSAAGSLFRGLFDGSETDKP